MDDQALPAATGPAEAGRAGNDPAGDDQRFAAAKVGAPGTGDPRVDAALTQLDQLSELPVGEHGPVFERVHAELTEVLVDTDPESAGSSG